MTYFLRLFECFNCCIISVVTNIYGFVDLIFFLSPRIICLKGTKARKCLVKFIYSEKATKFCKNFTLFLSYVVPVKSKVKISQNFVAFSEYINFIHFVLWRSYFYQKLNQTKMNFLQSRVFKFFFDIIWYFWFFYRGRVANIGI